MAGHKTRLFSFSAFQVCLLLACVELHQPNRSQLKRHSGKSQANAVSVEPDLDLE